jgi:septal ring-binding cell division protein DamX
LALAGAGLFVTYQAMHRNRARAAAPQETLPAGTEQVLPADLGTSVSGTPSLNPGSVNPIQEQAPSTGSAVSPRSEQPSTTAPPPASGDVSKPDAGSIAGLRYEIHVASFTQDGPARLAVKRLTEKGIDAWYAKATHQKNWYRVFVGHYATHEEAARQAASLLGRGLVEHAIAYPDHAR